MSQFDPQLLAQRAQSDLEPVQTVFTMTAPAQGAALGAQAAQVVDEACSAVGERGVHLVLLPHLQAFSLQAPAAVIEHVS